MNRKLFVASSISAALAACSPIGTALNNNSKFHGVLESTESLNHALIGTHGLAREYRRSDITDVFPFNSLSTPSTPEYSRLMSDRFASYRLTVDGAANRRLSLSLAGLARLQARTQITRHDCVEGWSAIAQWSGVRLGDVLALAQPRKDAKYVVFHCMDQDDSQQYYYESLDLAQAAHPQTLLATGMNGAPIPPQFGAPVRLRVPTQLGYKSAKWVQRIEIVGSFATIQGGRGGYWEDQGYEWYAGI